MCAAPHEAVDDFNSTSHWESLYGSGSSDGRGGRVGVVIAVVLILVVLPVGTVAWWVKLATPA